MIIGDRELKPNRALELLQDYAARYASTVRLYDLAGKLDGRPGPGSAAEPVNAVTLSDIGRLVVINAGLAAVDVATLLDIDATPEFEAVAASARLEDCEPGSDVYQAATALYEKYRLSAVAILAPPNDPSSCTSSVPGSCRSLTAAPSAFTAAGLTAGHPG